MNVHIVAQRPCLFFVVEDPTPRSPWPDHSAVVEAILNVRPDARRIVRSPFCRGVPIDRMADILEGGVDVRPVDAPIYVSSLDKASEYGGREKALMFFDGKRLDRTFREIPATTPQAQIDEIAKTFPTILTSHDGSQLWCSRLPPEDTALAKPYEAAYARWIPGAPFDALRAVVAYGPTGVALLERVVAAVSNAERHGWSLEEQ